MGTDLAASIAQTMETVAIDSAAASITVKSVDAGQRFVLYHLWIQVEGAVDVKVLSAANDLTGPIAFSANDVREWKNAPLPVFRGEATGEDLVLDNSGTAQINGFAVLALER